MNTLSTQQLFELLAKINTNQVETFFNFPEVIRTGNIHLNKHEMDYLYLSGYLEEKRIDSFGPIFQLSQRAKMLLRQVSI
ncbi:MAG: hypothetical protein ACJ748_02400 [Flavisolibacter sp.]